MSAFRRLPAQHRSMMLVLTLAMVVKLLVPVGWMPVFDGSRIGLELCGGYAPPPVAAHAMHHMGGTHTDHRSHDKHRAELPCPYAALAFAATDVDAPVFALRPIEPDAVRSSAPIVRVGRGLAAPPPPATGPPALA